MRHLSVLRNLPFVGLLLLLVAALGADLAALWVGFPYQEVDSTTVMRPAGSLSLPRKHRAYTPDSALMGALDWDGDGGLACLSQERGRSVPELVRSNRVGDRVWDDWMREEAALGSVSRAAWGQIVEGRAMGAPRGLKDRLAASDVDRSGDGIISHDEVVVALAALTLSQRELAGPACDDGWVMPEELPGVPQARPHPLGTDSLGRDLLVRLLCGLRVSLLVGLGATLVALLLGGLVGILAGYLGGLFDLVTLRSVELAQAIPFLVLVILASMLTRDLFAGATATQAALPQAIVLMSALGAVQWFSLARFARGQAAALRHAPYVVAVRAMGYPTSTILGRYILPAMALPLASFASLLLPTLILEEAFLSYLGLGIQPPYPSLGTLLSEGISWQDVHPEVLVWPATLLAGLTLSLFVLSDRLGAVREGAKRGNG